MFSFINAYRKPYYKTLFLKAFSVQLVELGSISMVLNTSNFDFVDDLNEYSPLISIDELVALGDDE